MPTTPAPELPPRQPSLATTWPFWLGASFLLLALTAVPPVRQALLAWDVATARWLNGFLGHGRRFDIFIAWLNDKKGDTAIVVMLVLAGLVQICVPWNRRGVCSKCAFWGWVGLCFCLPYVLQEISESFVHRQSPGRVLDGWFNLTAVYGVATRVRANNCFPSGHALGYFFFGLIALRRFRRSGLFILGLAATVPATRIMTGAHWFSDTYLSALPIAGLSAALAHETPIARVNRWIEMGLGACWDFAARKWLDARSRARAGEPEPGPDGE